jgi:hypothetical protein
LQSASCVDANCVGRLKGPPLLCIYAPRLSKSRVDAKSKTDTPVPMKLPLYADRSHRPKGTSVVLRPPPLCSLLACFGRSHTLVQGLRLSTVGWTPLGARVRNQSISSRDLCYPVVYALVCVVGTMYGCMWLQVFATVASTQPLCSRTSPCPFHIHYSGCLCGPPALRTANPYSSSARCSLTVTHQKPRNQSLRTLSPTLSDHIVSVYWRQLLS